MATDAAVAEQADTRDHDEGQDAEAGQGTPWWMWIAVAAIVIFCLFPFYWLINMSLKTGEDLGESSLFPPHPTLDELQVDLPERRLHEVAAQQRDHLAHARRRWRWSSARSAPTRSRACASRGKFAILALVLVDHDVPGDRDRRAAVPAVVGHRHLQHADRPDHPEPHVRVASGHLHPGLLLQGDPKGPRGGGAGRRRHPLHGVPEGRGAARGAGPRHGGHPRRSSRPGTSSCSRSR